MALVKLIVIAFVAAVVVEAKWFKHHKREATPNICDPANDNTKVQCYCVTDNYNRKMIRSANCHLVKKTIEVHDSDWKAFETLKNTNKVTFSNTMGIPFSYIPTEAIKHMTTVRKLEIKYGIVEKVQSFAFANLTLVEEIALSNNQIKTLAVNAFANHRDLTVIGLDTNELVEINRDVFVELPSLEKLYLTNNKITTIHDTAFVHLINLRELEIDRNGLFSLNSETFSGLKKLQKLDLSANNLEVIGDNTFLPLTDLRSLNLDGNKIQMLDEKAFNGLAKLNVLSLAHNNLTNIDSVKIFEGLEVLNFLSFKSNKLVELRTEVMAPILHNFYDNSSSLDVDENNFPCDCRLEWFMSIMNKTRNNHLKLAMENIKCIPDSNLQEALSQAEATEKTGGQVFDNEETQTQNGDYEYYDDVQLNGKLFYIDVRDLANCTTSKRGTPVTVKDTTVTTTKAIIQTTPKSISTTLVLSLAKSESTTVKPTSISTSTLKTVYSTERLMSSKEAAYELQSTVSLKKGSTTMSSLTESAKPIYNQDHDMASDEARIEKATKAHRSIQDNKEDISKYNNGAYNNVDVLPLVFPVLLSFRLCVN